MNLTNLSLLLNNFPMLKARRVLNAIDKISVDNFEAYIEGKKNDIVAFHLKNNPFYQTLGIKENWKWDDLPVLTKHDIQINIEDRLSKNVKHIYIGKTSGSTGNPFYFAKDKFCHALTWANIETCFSAHGLYGEKQARFYGIPKDKKGYYSARIKDFFLNRYRFNVFDLSDEAFNKWVQEFSTNKYVYLNGYTTVLISFAKYLRVKGLVLNTLCPTLKSCVVTSEMCFNEDKILMEEFFGVKVVNEYGASELDLIAFQNKQYEWLLNTQTLFIEILDKHNQPVKEGEMGRVVATSLYNKANPFIRYDLGDSAIIEKVNSKKIILKKLLGRNEDLVKLPSGKIAPGLTLYYVTKSIMEKNFFIKEIKVIQIKLDTFDIEYTSQYELSTQQKTEIEHALFKYLEPNLKLNFIQKSVLERSNSGKLKQFTSLIK